METVYELVSPEHSRPVLVQPLGEYFPSRWVKEKEHYAPGVMELMAKDARATVAAKQFGHAAPQHTGFAFDVFRHYGVQPVDLPDAITGTHIALDQYAKRVRLFDPLETLPNRKDIEAAFHAVYHRYRVPKPERVYGGLSDADLDVWLAWIDKAVSEGVARQVVHQENVTPEPEKPVEKEPETAPAAESVSEPVVEQQNAPVVPQTRKPVKAARRR